MKIIFICYTDLKDQSRGSSVRPYKMYTAFKDRGYDILLIYGDFESRRKKYLEFKNSGQLSGIGYCYIEPGTYPVHPMDYLMFLHIKSLKIPTGIFYRDMYHKFPDLYKKKGIRKAILLLRYAVDWQIYKRVSRAIFFPSDTMASYFDFHTKVALPPACEKRFYEKIRITRNVIYVGGISERYGTKVLLDAMKIVNERFGQTVLFLVCREENKEILDGYMNFEWLKVIKASGEELEALYRESDIAIIPILKIEYHELAFPVKLFEYFSFGLPVLATDCKETANFILKHGAGKICRDDSESMAQAIIELYCDPDKLISISENSKRTVLNGNLWDHRIERIEEYLLKKDANGKN